jgi:hypothetical protein
VPPGPRAPRLARLAVACLALAGTAAACSSDPPDREGAVEVLREVCDAQAPLITALDRPTDVFELEGVAYAAFRIFSSSGGEIQGDGLDGVEDNAVQRYLEAARTANEAASELARAAGFEDVPGMYGTLGPASEAMERLDASADRLGLPARCGGRAWGAAFFRHAAEVTAAESDAMAPTGNYVADLTTYCGRYRRSVDSAIEPTDLSTNRSYTFKLQHTIERLHGRVDALDPPGRLRARHRDLLDVLDEAATTLVPSERLAVDGDEAALQLIVDRTKANVRIIGDRLDGLGADC